MYGAWQSGASRMYLALATLGYTPKPDGGGSFGYGKAGLIRGSRIHSVVAYSCFRADQAESGVSRRLLGMTYWGQHTLNGRSYPGFARFGQGDGEDIKPYENEEADRIAESLGLALRNPDQDEYGTTFLVVDPAVEPEDLQHAVERYWWPALQDDSISFDVSVIAADGVKHPPRPKKNPDLQPFIRAYEIATVPQDNRTPQAHRTVLQRIGEFKKPGTVGLVAETDGWSYPGQTEVEENGSVEHRSLVALLRKPRMVVEYYEAGQTPPYVRGVFVADESIDATLRQTEPKAHDAWQTKPDDDGDPASAAVADTVLARVKSAVSNFRHALKPPKPPKDQVQLPEWDRLMRRLLKGSGSVPPPPPPGDRDVTISLFPKLEAAGGGRIRVQGTARFGLTERFDGDSAAIEVHIRYLRVEDDRTGEAIPLHFTEQPYEFVPAGNPGVYRGTIRRESPVQFTYESDPHDGVWTGRMIAEADVIPDPANRST